MNRFSKICDILTQKKIEDNWFGETPLKRCLTTLDLTSLGVAAVVGAGLYVVTGELARDVAGPAVVVSFFIAGVAALFSGICYAEFGCRIPRAGSAYVYSYATVGEFWAFFVGWNMILEYIIAAASLARACSEYINSFAQGSIYNFFMEDIAKWNVPALGSFPDFLAMALALVISCIVSLGALKSSLFNKVMTFINLSVIIFIICVGLYFVEGKTWQAFAPYGVNGVLKAAGSCFYAFVGFDVIATASEEALNPKRSIPLSIILTIVISFLAYFGVATVLTLMIPYNQLSQFAPLAQAFTQRGFSAAKYVVAIGGLCATMSSLLTATFSVPRILYSMATDGLLYNWFAHVHDTTIVPVRAALASGVLIAFLALLLDLKQLVEMLSIGTLMAYTMVVIAVLVTRYTPGVESVTLENDGSDKTTKKWMKTLCCSSDETDDREDISYRQVQNIDEETRSSKEEPDEKTSTRARVGVFTLTLSITAFLICLTRTYSYLGRAEAWAILLCCIFGLPIVASLMYIIRQPKNSAKFPFTVPGVPFVPAIAIFFNVLLIVNLNPWTYIRFSVWTALGLLVYFGYGYKHSVEGMRQREITQTQLIISQTENVGKEVEEYPLASE